MIRLSVRDDVPDEGQTAHPQVRMAWESGARKSLIGTVTGSLFVEEHGGGKDKITAWVGVANPHASERAAGQEGVPLLHRGRRSLSGDAPLAYRLEKATGRQGLELAVRREARRSGSRRSSVLCRRTHLSEPEVDPFEIGGEPNIRDGEDPDDVGSVRVTLYIDAERWLQVGSRLDRTDGHLLPHITSATST